jgi:hypothetical protein
VIACVTTPTLALIIFFSILIGFFLGRAYDREPHV